MQERGTHSGVRPPLPRTPAPAMPAAPDPDVEPTVELRVERRPESAAGHEDHDRPGRVPGQRTDAAAPVEPAEPVDPPAPAPPDIEAAVQRARLALGVDQGGGLEERRVSLVLEIDEHGVQRSLTQRTLWRATGAGAHNFPVYALLPTPVGERVVVEALEGCTSGPTYADLREGFFATSLLLDRRLSAGEEAETVHRITLPGDGAPRSSYEHQLKQYVDDVTVEIRFHRDFLPAGVGAYVRVGADEEAVPFTTTDTSVRATCGGFGPGVAGVRWAW